MQRVLRSNGWPSDSLSPSPWDALRARGDLSPDPEDRGADGTYDCKVAGQEGGGGIMTGVHSHRTYGCVGVQIDLRY